VEVALLDIRMPGMSGLEVLAHRAEFAGRTQVIVMTAQDSMENAVAAMKQGAFDYVTKPFDLEEIAVLVDKALENVRVLEELSRLKAQTGPDIGTVETALVGKSRAMQEIFKLIGRVANQDVTVLIQGESGTGKELIARAIHFQGARVAKPFIPVNCSAIPATLIESELFGHKKGAFTGATEDKPGYFERAAGGTIFLDEIGELTLEMQAKILRFLQDRTIQRVGEYQPKALDVRVIAATNRRLEDAVKARLFREDLFFRLNVVPIVVPPLRERREDIRALTDHFIRRYARLIAPEEKGFAAEALELLVQAAWPGNVRELENVIRRALVLGRGAVVTQTEIELVMHYGGEGTSGGGVAVLSPESGDLEELIQRQLTHELLQSGESSWRDLYNRFLPALERPLIRLALRHTSGNQLQAACVLGINRNTLRKRMRELDLDRDETEET
jgi:two-component system nitrogen regulation response regulator GlnG